MNYIDNEIVFIKFNDALELTSLSTKSQVRSNMIREKVININNQYILGVGTAKYLRVPVRCPKSKFQIGIIIFYEYNLTILTLVSSSFCSLVNPTAL